MAVHCIVPARMGSSRFPGKPLVKILGKQMIVRTMERALLAECFDRIVCATDSEEVAEAVSRAGFEFILTGPAATGSDRVAFAARALDLDLVVNLQGDEPLVEPSVLCEVAKALANEDAHRWFQHQGIYAYSRRCRDEFSSLPQSEVEKERSLEQMRIMGIRPIRIVQSPYPSISVDVPSDVKAVEGALTKSFGRG